MLDMKTQSEIKLDFNKDRSDQSELIESYSQLGRIHIPNFLNSESANKIYKSLEKQKEWNFAWNDQGKHTDLSYQGVMSWTIEQKKLLREKIYTQAEKQFQYSYSAIPIFDIYRNKLMPGHFFNDIYEFFNTPKFIEFARQVTGETAIKYTDMQATRFTQCDFLTEHDDNVIGKKRLAAYVLNLTPTWNNDWGGSLVFSDSKDSISESFYPKFNALNIFSVPQKHSVSFIAPFASADRYSITGWFRY